MTVPTLTLAGFLLERIARDEESAREAMGDTSGKWASWNHRAHQLDLRDLAVDGQRIAELPFGPDEHIARWDPARVLAECAAKRRIVGAHSQAHECPVGDTSGGYWPEEAACDVVRLLAAPFSDHPDYDPDWRP